MNSTNQRIRIGQVFGLLCLSAALTACGSSNSSTAADSGGASGTAATVVAVGPTTTVPTGSLGGTSTIKPASTTATPANTTATPASTTANSSSTTSSTSSSGSTLPPATSDTVTISWTAPSENTDGTALTNLAGYQINYGTSPSAMTQQISINTVGVMNYVVSNLSSGTWYFEIVAVNSAGEQSTPSSVVSTTI
jgi:hypothetical protein